MLHGARRRQRSKSGATAAPVAARALLCALLLPNLALASARFGVFVHPCGDSLVHVDLALRGEHGPVILHDHDCGGAETAHRHRGCPDGGADFAAEPCPAGGCCAAPGAFLFGADAGTNPAKCAAADHSGAASPTPIAPIPHADEPGRPADRRPFGSLPAPCPALLSSVQFLI
jgi:hypothetical protein